MAIRKLLGKRPILRGMSEQEEQPVPPERFVRYYFWGDWPYYGRRGGRRDGYDTLEELEKDMESVIKFNRERGTPCWTMKAVFHKRYV